LILPLLSDSEVHNKVITLYINPNTVPICLERK
jgi:hypothetical protein